MNVNLVKKIRESDIEVVVEGKKEKKHIKNVDFYLQLQNGQLVKIAPYESEINNVKYSTKAVLSAIADDISNLPFESK